MDKVPYETLSQIVGYLMNDQASLLQLNKTCHTLYEISTPLLFKFPQFNSYNSFQLFATTLTETNGYHVRHIDLHMVPHRWNASKMNHLLYDLTAKTLDLELLNLDLCTQLYVTCLFLFLCTYKQS